MNAAHLLSELRTLGVKVWPDAGALRFKAPAGAMTPELTARLKAAKPDLLAILAGDTEPATDPAGLERCAELDRIIGDLCAAARFADDVRELMMATRRRMSPDAIEAELPVMRAKLLDAEREAAAAIRRARERGRASTLVESARATASATATR